MIQNVSSKEEVWDLLKTYNKKISSFILVGLPHYKAGFTLVYTNGKLVDIECTDTLLMQYIKNVNVPEYITHNSPDRTLIYGYIKTADNDIFCTDIDFQSACVEYYLDRLELLQSWTFPISEYEVIKRNALSDSVDEYFDLDLHSLLIIPNIIMNEDDLENVPICLKIS